MAWDPGRISEKPSSALVHVACGTLGTRWKKVCRASEKGQGGAKDDGWGKLLRIAEFQYFREGAGGVVGVYAGQGMAKERQGGRREGGREETAHRRQQNARGEKKKRKNGPDEPQPQRSNLSTFSFVSLPTPFPVPTDSQTSERSHAWRVTLTFKGQKTGSHQPPPFLPLPRKQQG